MRPAHIAATPHQFANGVLLNHGGIGIARRDAVWNSDCLESGIFCASPRQDKIEVPIPTVTVLPPVLTVSIRIPPNLSRPTTKSWAIITASSLNATGADTPLPQQATNPTHAVGQTTSPNWTSDTRPNGAFHFALLPLRRFAKLGHTYVVLCALSGAIRANSMLSSLLDARSFFRAVWKPDLSPARANAGIENRQWAHTSRQPAVVLAQQPCVRGICCKNRWAAAASYPPYAPVARRVAANRRQAPPTLTAGAKASKPSFSALCRGF